MRARWLRIVLAGGVAFVVLGRCYLLCLDTFAPGGAGRSKTDIGTATSLQFRYRFWSGALLLSKVIAVPIHFRGVRTCAMFYAVPIYYPKNRVPAPTKILSTGDFRCIRETLID